MLTLADSGFFLDLFGSALANVFSHISSFFCPTNCIFKSY